MPYECRVYLKHKHKTPYIYIYIFICTVHILGPQHVQQHRRRPGRRGRRGDIPPPHPARASSFDVEAVVPMLDGLQQLGP